MRVGKGRCDKRLAQRKLSSNQRSENRHRPGWRFSPLIRIVTVYPKICSVIVIGISTTSSRRCDQPPAVRAAPDCILPSSAYSVKKSPHFGAGLFCCSGRKPAHCSASAPVPVSAASRHRPHFCRFPPHHPSPSASRTSKTTRLFPKKHGKNVENPCIFRYTVL